MKCRQRPLEYESNNARTLATSMDFLKTEYLADITRIVTCALSASGKGWWNEVPTEVDIFQLTKGFRVLKRVQFALEFALQQAFWNSIVPLVKQVGVMLWTPGLWFGSVGAGCLCLPFVRR
jgi:hypothetical protein